VAVWAKAEMLDGLPRVLWTSQEKGVASSWSSKSQLIEGQNLTTSGQNASASSSGKAESSNAKLRDSQKAVVIGDGTDDDNGLVVRLLRSIGDNSREGDWWSIDAGHEQTAEDDLVEGRVGAT
jgi:hypothetical protein